MKMLIPILLIVIAVAGGGGAGLMLKPEPAPLTDAEIAEIAAESKAHAEAESEAEEAAPRSYVQIGQEFIIPIVEGPDPRGRLCCLNWPVDVPAGFSDAVFDQEIRLRAAFNDVLFSMSHTGAFSENYTDDLVLAELKRNLAVAAEPFVPSETFEILILDMIRQEI